MQLRKLAEDRLADAACLLAAGRWSGAYYLAGYAVECGLKACIMARIERAGMIFLDKKFSERCWTHDLTELVVLAELVDARDVAISNSAVFEENWLLAVEWEESSRYRHWSQAEAEDLFAAIANQPDGVLEWIKKHW